jgi:hypothetical protein
MKKIVIRNFHYTDKILLRTGCGYYNLVHSDIVVVIVFGVAAVVNELILIIFNYCWCRVDSFSNIGVNNESILIESLSQFRICFRCFLASTHFAWVVLQTTFHQKAWPLLVLSADNSQYYPEKGWVNYYDFFSFLKMLVEQQLRIRNYRSF